MPKNKSENSGAQALEVCGENIQCKHHYCTILGKSVVARLKKCPVTKIRVRVCTHKKCHAPKRRLRTADA